MLTKIFCYIKFSIAVLFLSTVLTLGGILNKVAPSLVKYLLKKDRELVGATAIALDDFKDSFFNTTTYARIVSTLYSSLVEREAYEGHPAPNPLLVDLDGTTEYHLLDFTKKDRPLVVNFGSCS